MHFLRKQCAHFFLENYPQKPFGRIKHKTHFDLNEAKFFLQVNIHIGMRWKTCLCFGEEKQLLDFEGVCSFHGMFGLEQELVYVKPYHFATWKNLSERLIHSYLQPRGIKKSELEQKHFNEVNCHSSADYSSWRAFVTDLEDTCRLWAMLQLQYWPSVLRFVHLIVMYSIEWWMFNIC